MSVEISEVTTPPNTPSLPLENSIDATTNPTGFFRDEPVMISVVPKDFPHTYIFMKKDGGWFEVNDSRIFGIPKEWEMRLEKFCSANVSCISYKKIEENHASAESAQPPMTATLDKVTEQLKVNGLHFVDRSLYSILGCPESFFTTNATSWFSQK